MDRLSDSKRIVSQIVSSVRSPLRGFVYDKKLVDDEVVKEAIRSSGVGGVLARWSRGNLVVYLVDVRKLESLCRYEECKGNGVEAQICVRSCVNRKIVEVTDALAKSLLESIGVAAP
ncbi:MAG: hypothetical protein F7C08_01185 [Desulfurococcales archaeon]|nr:hypothetical protein [Desulfurococcales archaeon]